MCTVIQSSAMSEYTLIIRAPNQRKCECHTLPIEQQMFNAQQHSFQVLIKVGKIFMKMMEQRAFRWCNTSTAVYVGGW